MNHLLKRQTVAAALSLSLLALCITPMPQMAEARTYRASIRHELRQADESLQTGRYDQAEKQYMAILRKNPGSLDVRSSMAIAQAELFKLDAAEKNARQVLARDPDQVMARVALGIVFRNRTASQNMAFRTLKDEYLAESARQLEMAVQLDPRSPEALTQLGITYRFQGRYDEARQVLDRATRIDPRFAEALVNKGFLLLQQGRVDEAKATYRRAIGLNSKNYMAHYRLGEAYLAEQDTHRAIQSLNTALSLNPGNAAVITKMGEAYEMQGNAAAAIASFRKAIHSNPSYMPAYVGLSNLYDNRGDGELAMAELKSALNVNPRFNDARIQLGNLALSVDKPDQAKRYFEEAVQANPHHPEALEGLSQALLTMAQKTAVTGTMMGNESQLTEAEKHIRQAIQKNPEDLRLHLALLRINQLSGNVEVTEEELQQIVNTPALTPTDKMIRGEALMALGRFEEADAVFEQLIYAAGQDTQQVLLIADTLKVNGNLEGARKAYQRVARMDPGNVKAQRGLQRVEKAQAESNKSLKLANALNNWRQRESSIDFYEESLAKNPRQPEARLKLAKLYERYKQYDKAIQSYRLYLGMAPYLTEGERRKLDRKIERLEEKANKYQGHINTANQVGWPSQD